MFRPLPSHRQVEHIYIYIYIILCFYITISQSLLFYSNCYANILILILCMRGTYLIYTSFHQYCVFSSSNSVCLIYKIAFILSIHCYFLCVVSFYVKLFYFHSIFIVIVKYKIQNYRTVRIICFLMMLLHVHKCFFSNIYGCKIR
jgi:hypothetical protein